MLKIVLSVSVPLASKRDITARHVDVLPLRCGNCLIVPLPPVSLWGDPRDRREAGPTFSLDVSVSLKRAYTALLLSNDCWRWVFLQNFKQLNTFTTSYNVMRYNFAYDTDALTEKMASLIYARPSI